jgi:hypothetical protein
MLLGAGIPGYYLNPQKAADCSDVVVLEHYTAWCLSDQQLLKILSKAVLLDGDALNVLQQRGFGIHCGAEILCHRSDGTASEQYRDNVLNGIVQRRIPHRSADWYEIESKCAQIISEFIDGKNRHYPGSSIYENTLGGRVAVYASNGDFANGTFGNPIRLKWLHSILGWLSNDQFPVLPHIPHHCLCLARSINDTQLIALANLGTDDLDEIKLKIPHDQKPAKIETVAKDGIWIQQGFDYCGEVIRITCKNPIRPFEWFIIRYQRG